jgi:hypothetical protein
MLLSAVWSLGVVWSIVDLGVIICISVDINRISDIIFAIICNRRGNAYLEKQKTLF